MEFITAVRIDLSACIIWGRLGAGQSLEPKFEYSVIWFRLLRVRLSVKIQISANHLHFEHLLKIFKYKDLSP